MGVSDHLPDAAIAAGAKTTSVLTHGGAATTLFGWFTLNEIALIIGICASVGGLIANIFITWYWKRKTYELKRQQYQAQPEKQHE